MTKKPATRLIKTSKIESTAPPEYTIYKRLDRYNNDDQVQDQVLEFQYWDKFRKPQISNKLQNFVFGGILYDKYNGLRRDEYLLKQYNIKTIGYGSWVKNEDRINFLAALAVGLWDLQTVCKTNNLGKNKLQLDWGGIGKKGASGVFFSSASLITMPRYKRPDKYLAMLEEFGRDTSDLRAKYFKKVNTTRGTVYTLNKEGKVWIMRTAGWGSFAHEFGHFIDSYIGKNQKPYKINVTGENALPKFDSKIFLTSSTKIKQRTGTIDQGYMCEMLTGRRTDYNSLTMVERAFFDWLVAMYFVKQKNDTYRPNTQYKRLIQFTNKYKGKWGYWGSIVELWARTFEVYVDEFLTRKGVTNRFLVSSNAKFGRDVRYLDGGKVLVVDAASAYPTGAHVWQNKKVFEKIIDIFANL